MRSPAAASQRKVTIESRPLLPSSLPGALLKRPNTAFTTRLLSDAKDRVPRLRYELTEVALRNFLTDAERIGVKCEKYRTGVANGWSFPPLAECRDAWARLYGP